LPHFTGTAWQGGPELPDPELGWVTLNAEGGHPGNDPQHAAIRRWVAPWAGQFRLTGTLRHGSEQGDGVRGCVISDRQGLIAEWTTHNATVETSAASVSVSAGEAVDLLVDCRSGPSFDGFSWTVTIRLESEQEGLRREWNSSVGFRGPRAAPLGPWERLAQVLLMSNEFTFVD
jgi:hypothetical protein